MPEPIPAQPTRPTDMPRIGFIGAGRLATALAWGFSRQGCPVVAVASRSMASARRLALPIAGCTAYEAVQDVVDKADLVFISVNDGAIEQVAAGLNWRRNVAAVHCSGATEVAALDAAARQGAQTGGFHPMQSFTDPEAALASLPGCTISIEAAEPLHTTLTQLARMLDCRTMTLPPGVRVLYHAAGGYASQYVVALLREAATLWASFGISEEDAVAALLPLLRGTTAAVEQAGLVQGMPGPISRGDVLTVRRHVEALRALDAGVADLYCRLALRTLPLAEARGALSPAQSAELRELLTPRSVG